MYLLLDITQTKWLLNNLASHYTVYTSLNICKTSVKFVFLCQRDKHPLMKQIVCFIGEAVISHQWLDIFGIVE